MNDQPKPPLAGIRVFDLTAWMVGPWASRYLGALGADVLHIERPGTPLAKLGRVPPMIKDTSIGYIAWNLNKRGLALDLKDQDQLAFARSLVRECDVFMINMRPGVAERLGLGYETLAAENDRLVYCSITGWGTSGPIASKQGADTHLQAYAGFWSVNGSDGGRPEFYRHYTQLDATTGNYATQAILFALAGRKRTGKGQRIDITMLNAASSLQTLNLATAMTHDEDPRPLGSASRWTAPDEVYLCEDRRYLGISVTTDQQWHGLCEALKRPDLAQRTEFADTRSRVEHRLELRELLRPEIGRMPRAYWCLELGRHNVPYGYALDFDELRRHEQVSTNEYLVEVDAGYWGRVWSGGSPWRFDRYSTRWFAPPLPGEHTDEVRAEFPAPTDTAGEQR